MNLKKVIILLLSLVMISTCFSCQSLSQKELTQSQKDWIDDIQQIRKAFAKVEGINEFLSDKDRNNRLDYLVKKIQKDNWDTREIVYYLREIISDIRIAHIYFGVPAEYQNIEKLDSYILAGEWFGDDFVIFAAEDDYADCIGSALVAINGKSLEKVIKEFDRIMFNETDIYLKALFENELSKNGLLKSDLEYLGIINKKDDAVVFTFEKDGNQYEKLISPINLYGSEGFNIVYFDELDVNFPKTYEMYLKHPLYDYFIDKEKRALYFQYNECIDATTYGGGPEYPYFDKFFDEMMSDYFANKEFVDYFVFDLRHNTGGSENLWNAAASKYLNDFRMITMKVLIGKHTFSAGVDAIDTTLVLFPHARLYGEETGLAIHNYTDIRPTTLEKTGSELWLPTHADFSTAINKRAADLSRGVFPDVEIIRYYSDFFMELIQFTKSALKTSSFLKLTFFYKA